MIGRVHEKACLYVLWEGGRVTVYPVCYIITVHCVGLVGLVNRKLPQAFLRAVSMVTTE